MKNLLTRVPRFRAALTLFLLLGLLPTAALVQTAQAAPPRYAPAYGYRRKTDKRDNKRYKHDFKRDKNHHDRDNHDRDNHDHDNHDHDRRYSHSNRH